MKLTVELLDKKKHDRQAFDCGLSAVNEFLQKQASRQMGQKINRTWLLVDRSESGRHLAQIAGFFTLTTATVVKDELPATEPKGRFPGYPIKVSSGHPHRRRCGVNAVQGASLAGFQCIL